MTHEQIATGLILVAVILTTFGSFLLASWQLRQSPERQESLRELYEALRVRWE